MFFMRLLFTVGFAMASLPSFSWACTRILFNNHCHPGNGTCDAYSARTMDWAFSFQDTLMYIPVGQRMDGGCGGFPSQKEWTSKYWSVVASTNTWLSTKESNFTGEKFDYDKDGVSDGINEAGLAAHMLFLGSTTYPLYAPGAGAVTWARWVRYLLDTCANVSEAKLAMRNVTIAGVAAGTEVLGLHVAVEDKSGDSAIFEFVDGELQVYPDEGGPEDAGLGRDFRVMANDPPMPAQLASRDRLMAFDQQYPKGLKMKCNDTQGRDCSTFTSSETCPSTCTWNNKNSSCQLEYVNDCLPGDITSRARFARASYFLHFLEEEAELDPDTMLGHLRGALLSAAVPQGAPDQDAWDDGVYPTWWYSLIDFTQTRYYFGWYGNLNTVYVDLDGLPTTTWSQEKKIKYLNPRSKALVGDVTAMFSDRRPTTEAARPALRGSV